MKPPGFGRKGTPPHPPPKKKSNSQGQRSRATLRKGGEWGMTASALLSRRHQQPFSKTTLLPPSGCAHGGVHLPQPVLTRLKATQASCTRRSSQQTGPPCAPRGAKQSHSRSPAWLRQQRGGFHAPSPAPREPWGWASTSFPHPNQEGSRGCCLGSAVYFQVCFIKPQMENKHRLPSRKGNSLGRQSLHLEKEQLPPTARRYKKWIQEKAAAKSLLQALSRSPWLSPLSHVLAQLPPQQWASHHSPGCLSGDKTPSQLLGRAQEPRAAWGPFSWQLLYFLLPTNSLIYFVSYSKDIQSSPSMAAAICKFL